MEYIFREEQYGKGTDTELGWHYNLLMDEDEPSYFSDPVTIVPERYLIKYPENWSAVTFVGELN